MINRYESFSLTIAGLHRCVQKIETEEMEKMGLKGSYAQYLAALVRYSDGLTLSQLSELCFKDKAAVSRAITEMEKKQLVVRENNSDNSYRAKLTLTQKGVEASEYVRKRAQSAVELGGQGLSEEDRKVFYKSLELIFSNLRKINLQGLPEHKA